MTTRPLPSLPIALAWMGGSLTFFSCVAIAGREASKIVNTQQLMMWRGFLSLALIVMVALAAGRRIGSLRTSLPHLHLLRNTIHFGAQFAWFHALAIIPLVQLFALEFTAPLWVAVLAPLFLSERLTVWRLIAVVLGFAGALVVIIMPNAAKGVAFSMSSGSIWALVSALGFAFGLMTTKRITRTDDAFMILFYMSAIQAVFSLAIAASDWVLPDAAGMAWLFVVSAVSLLAHFCTAKAFARADAIIVAPMDFLRLPLIAFAGAQLYNETLDDWVLAGALVVIAANLVNMWGERRRTVPAH